MKNNMQELGQILQVTWMVGRNKNEFSNAYLYT